MLCDCMGGNGFREEYYPKPALNNRRNWRVAEDWRTCAYLLLWELQNYNSLLNNRQLENVGSHQKRIPHVQGQRRSPSKIVGGVNLCLESNPIPTRDSQRAQTNLVCTRILRPHRDWGRTVFECLLHRYGSAVGCFKCSGSGCSRPGYGISPLGGHH